jgi:hypothetical protein
VNEQSWLDCADPGPMIDWLGFRLTERQARHFAVACCRRTWHCFDPRLHGPVEVADRYARGLASRSERIAAEVGTFSYQNGSNAALALGLIPAGPFPAVAAALAISETPAGAYLYCHDPDRPLEEERAAQAAILRDIVHWPGRSARISPQWLTPAVRDLAVALEDDGDFERLVVLGDALEEAGCMDDDLLRHCRDRNLVHVPGCWLVRELVEAARA